MTPSNKFHRWIFRLALTLLILTTVGCASPGSKNQPSAHDEEAYIDFKQGFTLVVPSAWERQHTPVSSPPYRPGTVEWQIEGINDSKSTCRVRVISRAGSLPLPDYLRNLNNGRFRLTTEMATSIQHPAGAALRWESGDNLEKLILLIIEKPERRYILTCEIAAADENQLLPTVEKVISSFSILQN